MSTVNAENPKVDQTVRVFDEFYLFDISVPAMEYDIVNSYFRSVFKTAEAAQNFTTALFRVANQTQVPVLTIWSEIEDQDQLQLTATLAYYLNGLRSLSTLLGVNSGLTPNYFTARNILP